MSGPPLRVRLVDFGEGRGEVDKLVRPAFRGGTCTEATQPARGFRHADKLPDWPPSSPDRRRGNGAAVGARVRETDAERERVAAAVCASPVATRDDASLMSTPASASQQTG